MEAKVVTLTEKMDHDKETTTKTFQGKLQACEEKLKTLKASYKELERK